MIKQINNFTYKSFENYSGPKEEFKQKNIIFGYNGKGKTALSIGLKNEFLEDKNNKETNLRFYGKDFVEKNLMIKDSRKIKGVLATFGKQNVDVENEISKKERELIDTTIIEKEIEKATQILNEEVARIFNLRKGSISIKRKSANSVDGLLDLYKKDKDDALKLFKEEELETVNNTDDFEAKILNLKKIRIQFSIDFQQEELDQITFIVANKYSADIIPSSKILHWLEEGLEIHKNDNSKQCKFCGGELHLNEIEKNINLFIENKKQKDLKKLEIFLDKINSAINLKNELAETKIIAVSYLKDDINEIFDNLINNINYLDYYINILKNKINNMSNEEELNKNDLKSLLISINKFIYEINEKIDNQIQDYSKKIEKANILIKGKIGLEITKNSLINMQRDNIIKLNEELENTKKNNEIKRNEIIKLNNSKSSTSDFAYFLNQIIENLGMNFHLKVVNNDYVLENNNSDVQLTLNDISEGEQNLLALLFFILNYLQIMSKKNLKKKSK